MCMLFLLPVRNIYEKTVSDFLMISCHYPLMPSLNKTNVYVDTILVACIKNKYLFYTFSSCPNIILSVTFQFLSLQSLIIPNKFDN